MAIECVPVKFECYDKETKDLMFTVEAFDEECATVEIKAPVNVELWQDLSVLIFSAIKSMKLGTT